MHHHACVAVIVAGKIVHDQIANDFVPIHDAFNVLLRIQLAERFNQARLVLLADFRLGVVENVAVTVRVVVGINQLHVIAAHAEAETAAWHGKRAARGCAVRIRVSRITGRVTEREIRHTWRILRAVAAGRCEIAAGGEIRGGAGGWREFIR